MADNNGVFIWDMDSGDYKNAGTMNGPQGIPGPQGKQGIPGPQGRGLSVLGSYDTLAALEAAHPTGEPGEAYSVGIEEKRIYCWDADSAAWADIGYIRGPQGPQGDKGAPGARGEKGDKGDIGPQGERGERGEKGAKGDIGPQGERGLQGVQGVAGPIGPQGIQGEEGPQGQPGEKGDTGEQGAKGEKGDTGSPGLNGQVVEIAAGENVTVDSADPARPVIAAEVSLQYVDAQLAAAKDYTDGRVGDIDTALDALNRVVI